MRFIAALICLLAVSGTWGIAQTAPNSGTARDTTLKLQDGIALRLSVAKEVFHITEPIMVKSEMINRSKARVFVFPSEPWAMTTLTIFKDGRLYAPSGPRRTDYHFPSIRPWADLTPGATCVMRLRYDQDYYSIFYWGYGNGELPMGHYEIVAHPWAIGGQFANRQRFRAENTIASNTVTLDVVP